MAADFFLGLIAPLSPLKGCWLIPCLAPGCIWLCDAIDRTGWPKGGFHAHGNAAFCLPIGKRFGGDPTQRGGVADGPTAKTGGGEWRGNGGIGKPRGGGEPGGHRLRFGGGGGGKWFELGLLVVRRWRRKEMRWKRCWHFWMGHACCCHVGFV